MRVLRVGPGLEFETLTLAYDNAEDGDMLLLEPGNYGFFICDKNIHLVGNTDNVSGNKVYFYEIRIYSRPAVTKQTTKIVWEKLYIQANSTYYSSLQFYDYTNPDGLEFIYNRCYFGGYSSYNIYNIRSIGMNLSFINCSFNFFDLTSFNLTTETVISTRTHIYTDKNKITIPYEDYVYNAATGYGYNYGTSYFKTITDYYFEGTITEDYLPVSRVIKAYRHSDDSFMNSTVSDETSGKFTIYTPVSDEHYLICKADNDVVSYNDLIRRNITPAIHKLPSEWYGSYKFQLTIDVTSFAYNMYNSVVLISLDSSSGLTSYDTSVIFDHLVLDEFRTFWSLEDCLGNRMYCEIVKWDIANKEAIIWAQIPFIETLNNLELYLYYNRNKSSNYYNVSPPGTYTTTALWGSNSLGVWHMTETGVDVDPVQDATIRKHNCISYNIYRDDHEDAPLGKAINFTNGYLLIDDNIKNTYTGTMSFYALVKFNTLMARGTIFCLGGQNKGWEIGIDNGQLFSAIRTSTNLRVEANTTISGIDVDNYHLVTCLVDASKTSIYLDGELEAEATVYSSDFLGSNSTAIGSSYLGGAYDSDLVDGVTYVDPIPIVTVSGVVVSGTVMVLLSNGTTYYDQVGRHTFTAKNDSSLYINDSVSKFGNGSLEAVRGSSVPAPGGYNYNWVRVNGNLDDFELGDSDFTITFWVYVITNGNINVLYNTDGQNNGLRVYAYRSNSYYRVYFVLYDAAGVTIYSVHCNVYKFSWLGWHHIAIVRKNTTIYIFIDGVIQGQQYIDVYIHTTTATMGIMLADVQSRVSHVEVTKGYARWTSNFSLNIPNKTPDTFFPGLIDEIMLYNQTHREQEISLFYDSIKDNLITYS